MSNSLTYSSMSKHNEQSPNPNFSFAQPNKVEPLPVEVAQRQNVEVLQQEPVPPLPNVPMREPEEDKIIIPSEENSELDQAPFLLKLDSHQERLV